MFQQSIVFESLANSACNSSDFACICTELQALGGSAKVAGACRPEDAAQYNAFQANVCGGGPLSTPASIIVTPTPAPTPAPAVNATTSAPVSPAKVNGTAPGGNGTNVVSASLAPNVPVGVAPAGATGPNAAQFTGGASSMKIGMLAGAMGIMGFVFAEL